MNATAVNRTICISCSSSCVGIIHSQYGLDQGNIALIPRTVTDSGQNCTEIMPGPPGMYFIAIFKLMSGRLDELPSYKTVIPIGWSTSTTASGTPLSAFRQFLYLLCNTHTDAHTRATSVVDNSEIGELN